MDIAGSTALVTGANRGLGRQLAAQMLAAGRHGLRPHTATPTRSTSLVRKWSRSTSRTLRR